MQLLPRAGGPAKCLCVPGTSTVSRHVLGGTEMLDRALQTRAPLNSSARADPHWIPSQRAPSSPSF